VIDSHPPSKKGEAMKQTAAPIAFAPDGTANLKVRDGLLFNAVRHGDQVEVTVENIDGAKAIVGLIKE
jgi:hypothetical protein